MILVISVCSQKLSEKEFVEPVARLCGKYRMSDYRSISEKDIENADGIIICGTALKDFGYLENIKAFSWLKKTDRSVLGICAGMQIIAKTFGLALERKTMIGTYDIKCSGENEIISCGKHLSYFLISLSLASAEGFETVCSCGESPCAIKRKNIYALSFHPEVLNPQIIRNFERICKNM